MKPDEPESERDIVEQLESLSVLRAAGDLTDHEYEAAKARVLGSSSQPTHVVDEEWTAVDDDTRPSLLDRFKAQSLFVKLLLLLVLYGAFIGVTSVVALVGNVLDGDNGDSSRGSGSGSGSTPAVQTRDARSEVDSVLLGVNWTGSGSYTLESAAKAQNTQEGYSVYAARIDAPGMEDTVLFWRVDGDLDSGLIIGDTLTREFSVWGSAASAGSPADDQVNAAKRSEEGQAVIVAVRG